jgi:hypothetical protein
MALPNPADAPVMTTVSVCCILRLHVDAYIALDAGGSESGMASNVIESFTNEQGERAWLLQSKIMR